MGCWDELCLVCGVAYGGSSIADDCELDEQAQAIAKDLLGEIPDYTEDDLREVVRDGLASTSVGDSSVGRKSWMPFGLGADGYQEMCHAAVGYFNGEGESDIRNGKGPDGKNVEVRWVYGQDSGSFSHIARTENGKIVMVECETNASCTRDENNLNFAVCGHCYHYVKAWLDWLSFPPRERAFPSDPEPLSFAGEFYEIVNSRKEQPSVDIPATLSEISYDGIQDTLEQWQDHYIGGRRGAKHTAKAIRAGARGADLVPALLRDCGAWMFMLTNLYPVPPKVDRTPTFTPYPPLSPTSTTEIAKLPNELLLHILPHLPLTSLFALASTCRLLRSLILEPSFLDTVLKEALIRGSLRWLLPVAEVKNEAERAYEAMRLWLPEAHRPQSLKQARGDVKGGEGGSAAVGSGGSAGDGHENEHNNGESDVSGPKSAQRSNEAAQPTPIPSMEPLLASPHFPRLAFIRECWESDSMMNRKRLWGQVKQFDGLWMDYRSHGWQVDRFYSSESGRNGEE